MKNKNTITRSIFEVGREIMRKSEDKCNLCMWDADLLSLAPYTVSWLVLTQSGSETPVEVTQNASCPR